MRRLVLVVIVVGLVTSAVAETMDKEEFIDTYAKLAACVEAKHIEDKDARDALAPRVQYYALTHFSKPEIDGFPVVLKLRAKKTITMMGWGCEAAFKKLMALPLPPPE